MSDTGAAGKIEVDALETAAELLRDPPQRLALASTNFTQDRRRTPCPCEAVEEPDDLGQAVAATEQGPVGFVRPHIPGELGILGGDVRGIRDHQIEGGSVERGGPVSHHDRNPYLEPSQVAPRHRRGSWFDVDRNHAEGLAGGGQRRRNSS